MKKDYSVDEMKKIMGQDMEVPKSVDEGMKTLDRSGSGSSTDGRAFHHGVCGDKISQCNAK